jgi:hypothetical protein
VANRSNVKLICEKRASTPTLVVGVHSKNIGSKSANGAKMQRLRRAQVMVVKAQVIVVKAQVLYCIGTGAVGVYCCCAVLLL